MRKKTQFREDEVALGESDTDALLYKRDGWWQLRIYLREEGKYLRRSLGTKSLEIAKERGNMKRREVERDKLIGKKQFGLTVEQGVEQYLARRKDEVTEVAAGGITAERWSTIQSQLKNFLRYMRVHKEDVRLRELEKRDTWNYFDWRRGTAQKEPATSTLLNEQAMINACIRYLFEQHEISIPALDFPKIRLLERNDAQRTTPTKAEYAWIISEMARRTAAKGEMLTDYERQKRKLFESFVRISAQSGMRMGEQYQLRWENVKTYKKHERNFAEICVLATTTKVRKQREISVLCGAEFERMKGYGHDEGYVFSMTDGKTHIERTWIHRSWREMLVDIAETRISATRKALLVPYSLRHWFITRSINAGAEVSKVARLCGTSPEQINKTYYHLQKEEQEQVVMLGIDAYKDDWEDNKENYEG